MDSNWTPNSQDPQNLGDIATFGNVITGPRTVTLDSSRSIAGLAFNSDFFAYTISGSTSRVLTLNNTFGLTQNGAANIILSPGRLALATNQVWQGNGTGVVFVTRPISGAASLTKEGSFTLALSGSNTFVGTVTVNAGTLRVANNNSFGNTANDITLNGGTVNTTSSWALGSGRVITLGANGGTFDTNSGTTLTLNTFGQLTGAGTLTKLGAGTLTVSQANTTFTGATAIDGGAIRMSERRALGAGPVTLSNDSQLQLNYGSVSNATFGDVTINDGTIRRTSSSSAKTGILGAGSTLTVNGNAALIDQGNDNVNGYLSVDGAVQINTGGTLTVTATSGNDAVRFGGSASSITLAAGSTLATTGAGTVSFGSGAPRTIVGQGTTSQEAVLRLGATTHNADAGTMFQVNGSGAGGLRVEGTKSRVDSLVSDARLAAATGSGGTFTLAYTDAGNRNIGASANLLAPSNLSLGLTSNGGTFTLGTAGGSTGDLNNWAGLVVGPATTVAFADNNVFSNTADLTLMGGVLALNGTTQTFDNLIITANSVIDFGAGASSLNINSLTLAAGITLTIENWNDAIDFFVSQLDPGFDALSQITFSSYSTITPHWQTWDKQVTPVPEPSIYGAILSAFGVVCYLWHRRRDRAATA